MDWGVGLGVMGRVCSSMRTCQGLPLAQGCCAQGGPGVAYTPRGCTPLTEGRQQH